MREPQKGTPLSGQLGGETDRGVRWADLHGRLDRFHRAKQRAITMVNHIESLGHVPELPPSALPSLRECGSYLRFQYWQHRDVARLAGANFCKIHLLCPLCAIRRGARSLRVYLDKWMTIQNENKNLRLWFVTFTIKNGFDLSERFDHLNQSITKLRKQVEKQKLRNSTLSEFAKAEGGLGSFETTFSDTHGYHPHIHFILALDKDAVIDSAKLSEEWRTITGDSFIVDAKPTYGEPIEAFVEITKYALKFSDMRENENFNAYLTLRGRRLFRSFGCFYGVEIPDDLTDEEMNLDEPFIEYIFRHFKNVGYQCVEKRSCDHSKPFNEILIE